MNVRKVSEDAAPSLCSQKTPPPRGTSRWREWCKCAGIVGTVVAFQAGCTGAQVRQSPTAECRKEAVEAMKMLELPFETQEIDVQVDLTFPSPDGKTTCRSGPCIDQPGPVTSLVVRGSGALVKGTLLRGHVFEEESNKRITPEERARGRKGVWVYRWTEATLPNGDKHPVCIEAGKGKGTCPDGRPNRMCAVTTANPVKRWVEQIIP